MKNACFDTDLTDDQWHYLEPLMPKAAATGRPRTPLREVVDALLYMAKAGCPWRLLPKSFPPSNTVFHIFRQWIKSGFLGSLHDRLRAFARQLVGKRCRPTAGVLDSQTVRSAAYAREVGYDAGKKTKGRKRFLLVDTVGYIIGIFVCPANVTERDGAKSLLSEVLRQQTWLQTIWVDGGYSGEAFAKWVMAQKPGLKIEVVKRSDDITGFKVLPKRWIVERTFGWFMHHRRLVRDYERTSTSVIGWTHWAMIRIMLRRLA